MGQSWYMKVLAGLLGLMMAMASVQAEVPLEEWSKIEDKVEERFSIFNAMLLLKSRVLNNIRLYGRYGSEESEVNENFPPHPAFYSQEKLTALKQKLDAINQRLSNKADTTAQEEAKADLEKAQADLKKAQADLKKAQERLKHNVPLDPIAALAQH